MAKIGIIDDHRLFLDGLYLVLSNLNADHEFFPTTSPMDLLQRIREQEAFDLIICDLVMLEMNGLAFLVALKTLRSKIPVLVTSGIMTDPPIQQIQALGGKGFIHKSAQPEALEQAINAILAGGTVFPGEAPLTVRAQETVKNNAVREAEISATLTPRQLEILKLLATGASNREISTQLHISQNTTKTHLKQIFQIMDVSRRTECAQKARLIGLV